MIASCVPSLMSVAKQSNISYYGFRPYEALARCATGIKQLATSWGFRIFEVFMSRRIRPDEYFALATRRGFKWLGPEVSTVNTKTTWQCLKGHQWEAVYCHVNQGTGCPHCAGNRRKTDEDYHALATRHGFKWLGPSVPNTATGTIWQCDKGHQWKARYSNINTGYGCPHCAGYIPIAPNQYQELANQRSFEWLGPEVPNVMTSTSWQCELGHEWSTSYLHIRQGTGCPVCAIEDVADRQRLKPSDYHKLAEQKGFKWLGPEVPNNQTKTWWQCKEGHKWQARYGNINFDRGCPECIDFVNGTIVSKNQRAIHDMLGGELNCPFGRYKVDVALEIDEERIAIEYDSYYWHKKKQGKDAQRDRRFIDAGWRVLRIKSDKLLPEFEEMGMAIATLLNGHTYIEIVLEDWGNQQYNL